MKTTVRVPVWLLEREPPSCHKVVTRGRYGEGFVHRTLGDYTSTRRSILSALPAKAGHGWLQMVDARVKVLGALLLLIVAGMARNHTVLLVLCVLAVSGAVTSGLPALSILRRALLPALFAAILVLPAALTWLRPGHPILVLCQFQEEIEIGPWSLPPLLAVTAEGIRFTSQLVLRVLASVVLAGVAVSATGWPQLLYALRALGLPRVFLATLEVGQRYLIVLLHTAEDYFQARKSRFLGGAGQMRSREFTGHVAAILLAKAYHLGELVHQAMVSRGYLGEPAGPRALPLGARDFGHLAAVLILAGLLLGGDVRLGW